MATATQKLCSAEIILCTELIGKGLIEEVFMKKCTGYAKVV